MRVLRLLLILALTGGLGGGIQAFAEETVSEKLIMFAPGDAILDDLRILALETHHMFFSYTPPLSSYEVKQFLDRIEEEDLSVPGQEAYRRIQQRLVPKTFFSWGGAALSASLMLKGEFSAKTNTDIDWVLPDLNHPDFIRVPVDLFFMDILQLHFEMAFQHFPGVRDEDSHINTNIVYAFDYFDGGGFPFRAFASLGKNWWNIQIGRDRLSFGNAHSGNLLLTDSPDYYDFARLSVFNTWIKYSIVVSQIPISFDQSLVDPSIVDLSDPYYNPPLQTKSLHRYFYLHRLDVALGKKFSIGITEQMITGNSSIQLRYLNPLMFMHNFFAWYDSAEWGDGQITSSDSSMDNMLLSIDFRWTPIRNLSIYGQWILDEMTATFFERDEKVLSPDALGYLAGIEYYHVFKKCAALFFIELVYTDPYLYVDNNPLSASIWYRRMIANPLTEKRYRWLGHPNGRDAITLMAGSHLSFGKKWWVNADIQYLIQGERGIGIVWGNADGEPYVSERTPVGTPRHTITLYPTAVYALTKSITLQGGIAGSIVVNAGKETLYGAEFSLGARYVFDGIPKKTTENPSGQ
jgi:hypothetical protein